MIMDSNGINNYIRTKSYNVLDALSDKDIEIQYGSYLKDNGGLTIIKKQTRRFFVTHTERRLEISDEYASQVFYRYTIKQFNRILQRHISQTAYPLQKARAEEYSNILKNIEIVYNNRKDTESFDSLVKRTLTIMLSSLELTKEKNEPSGLSRDLENAYILEIRSMAEIKNKNCKSKQKLPSI